MSKPYEARPGTIAYRAIAHLETLPPGTERSTGALAEAIGVDPNNLPPCLAAAVDGGVLAVRQKDHSHPKSPRFWRLAGADDITPKRDSQQVLKAEPATADATARETPAMRSPDGGPMGAGQPAAAGPAGDLQVPQFLPTGASSRVPKPSPAPVPPKPGTQARERVKVCLVGYSAEEVAEFLERAGVRPC